MGHKYQEFIILLYSANYVWVCPQLKKKSIPFFANVLESFH